MFRVKGLSPRRASGLTLFWRWMHLDPCKAAFDKPLLYEQGKQANQALETLESMIESTKNDDQCISMRGRLATYTEHERLSGGWAEASGEQLPFGIASTAFDGLESTKWEEPEGAKGFLYSWKVEDARSSQLFSKRRYYRVPPAGTTRGPCSAYRLRFLSARDSSSQSRLQLSCVNFYKKKSDSSVHDAA